MAELLEQTSSGPCAAGPLAVESLAVVPWEDVSLVPTPARSASFKDLYAATVLPQAGTKRRATSPTRGARELGKMLRGAASSISTRSTSAASSDAGSAPQDDRADAMVDDDGACSASAPEDVMPLMDAPAEEAPAPQELPPEVARARQRAERARLNAAQAVAQRLARQAREEQQRQALAASSPQRPEAPEAAADLAAEEGSEEALWEIVCTPTKGPEPREAPAGAPESTPRRAGCSRCRFSRSGCSSCRGKAEESSASKGRPGRASAQGGGVRKQGKLKA